MDKQKMKIDGTQVLADKLQEATYDLAEHLSQSEPIQNFRDANKRLMADEQSMKLLAVASKLQQKIYAEQYSGKVSNDEISQLRDLRNQVAMNETIQTQAIAREEAVAFLREINLEISNLLGFDFASFTRRPGSGC